MNNHNLTNWYEMHRPIKPLTKCISAAEKGNPRNWNTQIQMYLAPSTKCISGRKSSRSKESQRGDTND